MTGCSIRKCKSRSVKGGSINFFSFPREESVANEWLRHCRPKTNRKHGRVCSNHFVPSDYLRPLRNILLNIAPRHARQLKPDAIPTLLLENIDKQNTPKVINIKNVIINTTENMNSLPPYNTIAANDVAGLSVESRPIGDKQNTPNVKIEIVHTSENMNCLPQCTAIPINGVVGLYKPVEKRPINDKRNTSNVTVEGENGIILTAENMNCLPQFITIPANEAAVSSKVNDERYSTDQPPMKPLCAHNTKAYQCSKVNSNYVLVFNKAFYATNDKIKQDNFILKLIVPTAINKNALRLETN